MQKMKALLVTGANGFVGQSYLEYILSLPENEIPEQICLVSRNGKINNIEALHSKTKVRVVNANLEFDWVFDFKASHIAHFAGDGTHNAYSKDSAKTFIKIVLNLKKWVRNLDRPTVFFASTGACYGGVNSNKSELINSRLQGEQEMLDYHEKNILDLRIGRLFSFIGNFMIDKPQYAVTSLVNSAVEKSLVTITGNAQSIRSYLNASEMSSWIHKSLQIERVNQILDIGSRHQLTILDLAKQISLITGAKILEHPNMDKKEDYFVKNSNTLKLLGVEEAISWQNSLNQYVNFVKESRLNA
jgi:nucleoside-diphosphate-sugar epimerase